MSQFRYAHAGGKDWREVADSCARQLEGATGTLGFLYATDRIGDHLSDVLALLRKTTSVAHWVGTVGLGVCATGHEYLDEPAAVAMIGDFEPDSFKVFSGIASEDDVKRLELKCAGTQAAFALVHADPYNAHVGEIVTRLADKVESGFLVGGLTSSRQQNLQIADRVMDGGVSGVAFADSVTIATRLTQGCSPIGPKHAVTGAQRNIIITLDGRPALEVFLEDIGEELASEIERIGGRVFAGLPIRGSDTGDYLVRNLVGLDPSNKLVAIGEILDPDASVMFCRRDADTAQEDMTRMLDSIRQGLYAPPRGAVYYSCLGRGASLFGPNSEELKMIASALGDIPLVGFFCNGEISHNRLYGYTGVLTLFL
ncbi:MAG TPA: FIST N-terminal domain-containing protein [Burkholderiales bacterium]|nr:FIST N-terminal domain-containing protein [Burkholderiales bacterium]